jgi:hypothetical protein
MPVDINEEFTQYSLSVFVSKANYTLLLYVVGELYLLEIRK